MEKRKTYSGLIDQLNSNQIFVFGSNTEGRHGAGAAKFARENAGAIYGRASGLQGNSYAIITKDLRKRIHPSISKEQIIEQIKTLYAVALENPNLEYLIAYSGSGKNLNAYTPFEMAEMFNQPPIPANIIFEETFNNLLI